MSLSGAPSTTHRRDPPLLAESTSEDTPTFTSTTPRDRPGSCSLDRLRSKASNLDIPRVECAGPYRGTMAAVSTPSAVRRTGSLALGAFVAALAVGSYVVVQSNTWHILRS